MNNPCRCGHTEAVHRPSWGYSAECLYCKCPEYRAAETADTQTLNGTEASA